jgi:hypothetical protein
MPVPDGAEMAMSDDIGGWLWFLTDVLPAWVIVFTAMLYRGRYRSSQLVQRRRF